MNRNFFVISAMLVSLAGLRLAGAKDLSGDLQSHSSSYQVIQRNNIFNPLREPTKPILPPPVPVYTFALNGTMTYENQGYAFFEGNGVNRSHVFSSLDTINGYQIAEITNNTVKLAAACNQFILLKVGTQMHKVGNGPWTLVASSELNAP